MKIQLVNVHDESVINEVAKQTNNTGKSVLFVDWIPVNQQNDAVVQNQINILESQHKATPIIVFDRNCSITDTELVWFNERNIVLMEPAVNHRNGFIFHPYWLDMVQPEPEVFEKERKFDTGVSVYNTPSYIDDLLKGVSDEYTMGNHCIDDPYSDFKTLLLFSSDANIERGVIPYVGDMIKQGTVPLLYHNHKWLHAMFHNLVVHNVHDLEWYCKLYDPCGYGFTDELYKSIDKYMPEMRLENFVSSIIRIFNKIA